MNIVNIMLHSSRKLLSFILSAFLLVTNVASAIPIAHLALDSEVRAARSAFYGRHDASEVTRADVNARLAVDPRTSAVDPREHIRHFKSEMHQNTQPAVERAY